MDRQDVKLRLQTLDTAIREHIDLVKRQQGEAQKRKEELQEEPEDEEDGGDLRALAIEEVEKRARLLETDQAYSGVVAEQVRSRMSGQKDGSTYSSVFSGSNNMGVQIGYSNGSVNWNSHGSRN
jgi:hypothetical protein